jgi:lauroyl/myristoyl acyltransferase
VRPTDLIKDIGGMTLYQGGPKLLPYLPRAKMIRAARPLADLIFKTARADVEIMREEITKTLGPTLNEDVDDIIKRSYRLRLINELEVLRFPKLGPHNISATAILEGEEHLQAALAKGKGAIIMIGHFGANQMIMPALGYAGYTMNQLSASPTAWFDIRKDGRVNPLFKRVQMKKWTLEQTLPTQHIDVFGFMRPAFDCLKRNELLGLACDGGGGSNWVGLPLGERTAWVPSQPWLLARSTGAPIIPTTVLREPDQSIHRVIMSAPIHAQKTRDKTEDAATLAKQYGEYFTEWVRRFPCHYAPYLLLRHKVAISDDRAFFDDY